MINIALVGNGIMANLYADIIVNELPYLFNILYVIGSGKRGNNVLTDGLQSLLSKINQSATNNNKPLAKGTNDINVALNDKKVDAVLICTPRNTHESIIRLAVASGKHIFTEKPLVPNGVEVVKEMFDACQSSNLLLFTAMQRRFDPTFVDLKHKISVLKQVGNIELIKIHSRDPPSNSSTPRELASVIWDSMIHDVDMACWLIASTPTSVYAIQTKPNNLIAVIHFESGAIATIDYFQGANTYDQRVEVHGSTGKCEALNQFPFSTTVSVNGGTTVSPAFDTYTTRYRNTYRTELIDFHNAFVSKRPSPTFLKYSDIHNAHLCAQMIENYLTVASSASPSSAILTDHQNKKLKSSDSDSSPSSPSLSILTKFPTISEIVPVKISPTTKSLAIVRIALIGVGRMGQIRAKLIRNNPLTKLVYIVDANLDLAAKVASSFPDAIVTDDVSKAVSDDEVDGVWIATGTATHLNIIMKAAEHKKHIYVEKPVALSVKEIEQAFFVCKQYGVTLSVGWQRRFDPDIKILLSHAKSDLPATVDLHCGDFPCPPVNILIALGSIYHDFLVHELDLVTNIMSTSPKTIFATGTTFFPELKQVGVIDTGVIVLTYANGTMFLITGKRYSPGGYDQTIEMIMNDGRLISTTNPRTSRVEIIEKTGGKILSPFPSSFEDRYHEAYSNEVSQFALQLQEGIPQVSSNEQCQLVGHLCDFCLQSYETKKEIRFE